MAGRKHFGAETVTTSTPLRPTADMNVTPFIDVLLVLLIMFMVALPMSQAGIDINLPLETQTVSAANDVSQIVVELTAERQLSVNRQVLQHPQLEEFLRGIFETRREKTLFIVADGSLRYGDVVDLIDAARGAGVERVGIVTDEMRGQAAAD